MSKNTPKDYKNKIKFHVFYLTLSDFIKIFEANRKKNRARQSAQGGGVGENALAGEHKFNLLEMLLMKVCYARN